MNIRNSFLAVVITFSSCSIFAQKYTSTEKVIVVKDYNGSSFSSEKTLLENLTDVEGFEVFTGLLTNQGTAIFTDEAMVTVFVIQDEAFQSDTDESEAPIVSQNLLSYLVVPGRLDHHGIKKAIEKGGGSASFATLSGEKLIAKFDKGIIKLFDQSGNSAAIVASDFYHQHGFFHIVNALIQPTVPE